MNAELKLQREMKTHGFKLVREDKHKVYKDPDGRTLVLSSTPSSPFWAHRALADLNRIIALPPQPEVLCISECERAEAAAILARQEKIRQASSGGANRKSHGCGFSYLDRVLPVLTPEQIEQSRKASQYSKAKESCWRIVRRQRSYFLEDGKAMFAEVEKSLIEDTLTDPEFLKEAAKHYAAFEREAAESNGEKVLALTFQEYIQQNTRANIADMIAEVHQTLKQIAQEFGCNISEDGETVKFSYPDPQANEGEELTSSQKTAIKFYNDWLKDNQAHVAAMEVEAEVEAVMA